MRIGLYAFAAAAILAVTVPATAQELRVRAGDEGVKVRVGRDHDDGWRHRDEGFRHREGFRESRRGHDCRTITIRKRTPEGMVVKKIRKCD
jgi:hypothetical protein